MRKSPQSALSGAAILVLMSFTSFAAAEPPLPVATESSATSDVKPETLPRQAVPYLPSEEKEEEKRFDQRLLIALFRPVVERYPAEKERQDLTFWNFFSYGWDVGWKEPEEGPDDAPRFRLLRIQRAYWEREIRLFHNYTFGMNGGALDRQEVEMEIELPVSRRFLIEFEPSVAGVKPNGGSWDFASGDLRVIPQVMLYETRGVSFSSGLNIRTPTGSQSVLAGRTSLTPYLTLWTNLGQRVGLHTFFGSEFPLAGYGPAPPGAFLQYGIAPTKTVTSKDTPFLGNLTLFIEFNGTTQLGGTHPQTTLTALPGVRWLLFKDFWLAGGYEFPLSGTNALDSRVWSSIYRDF